MLKQFLIMSRQEGVNIDINKVKKQSKHQDELLEDWYLCQIKANPKKIEPLK